MANLNSFVHYACGVVNYDIKKKEDKEELLKSFIGFIESYQKITDYYIICHDETEIIHIHFIFYSVSQVQLVTYFNKMRDWFVFKKKETRDEKGIQIEKCESINAHLKYVVHQDKKSIEENKKRYELDDIISNVDVEIMDTIINSRKGVIDAYYLRDCVLDSKNDFELMVKLGLNVYHRYSREIQTLKEERIYLKALRDEERAERLPF